MSVRSFVRQLGFQPGIQLNPLIDNTDGAVPDNSDQVFAVLARLTRGRIDRPFRTNRANFLAKTGAPESIRTLALNEAKLQAYEALGNGAYEAVVQRLTVAAAVKSYGVVTIGTGAVLTPVAAAGVVTGVTVTTGGTGYITGQSLLFTGLGTGAVATITAVAGVITAVTVSTGGTGYTVAPTVQIAPLYAVSATVPVTPYDFYFMHQDCYNDGIKVSLHADSNPISGTPIATKLVKLRLFDSVDNLIKEFEGSFDPAAKDDYGQSKYLPDIVSAQCDYLDIVVAGTANVSPISSFYGRDSSGKDAWATSAVMICFTEGSTAYASTDYDRCITALRDANTPYGYLISGGSQAVSLLGKLASLAIEANMPLLLDISGSLDAASAITFANSLNIDSHYVHMYWTPVESDDPLNGGKAIFGSSGLNVGYRCARNARLNAKGFAPKNYPVAGKEWPLNRTGMRQLVSLKEQELSDLARTKINPVLFETYNGGGKFVFTDCLTSAKTVVSYKKLINVAEMSLSIDNWVTLYAKELMHLPMTEFIKRMNVFLDALLNGATSSGWLVPSKNLPGNVPFEFEVVKSSVRPADLALVTYWCSYDGVARQVIVQQNLVK
jgi:hypothetical protein